MRSVTLFNISFPLLGQGNNVRWWQRKLFEMVCQPSFEFHLPFHLKQSNKEDCFRAFDNTKVGVEEDVSWSFFRVNGLRRFEDDDSSNRHGPCGIHSHFLRWGKRRKFVFQTFFWNMSSYWSRMSKVILSYLKVFRLGVSKHGHAVLDVWYSQAKRTLTKK